MSNEWCWLAENETVVWEGRPRLTTVLGSVGLGLGITLLGGWLAVSVDPLLAAVGLIGLVIPIWSYLWIQRTTYLVTTRAVWEKTGVLGRSVRRVSLSKVQNTAYEQSARGSLFGYGTVTIEVAGGRDLAFRRIDNPRPVQEAINDEVDLDNRELPGSIEQWQAVLSTIREIRRVLETRLP